MNDERSRPITASRHVGSDFAVGETLLYKQPGWSFDVPCELRAIDGNDALVILRGQSQIVEVAWLRHGVPARP